MSISQPSSHNTSFLLFVEVTVTNTGDLQGSEVVQLYITLPDIGLTTPRLQLKGFAKARDLEPGKSEVVEIELDKYAISYWDTSQDIWRAKAGTYTISIGKSSDDIVLEGSFELERDFQWVGL